MQEKSNRKHQDEEPSKATNLDGGRTHVGTSVISATVTIGEAIVVVVGRNFVRAAWFFVTNNVGNRFKESVDKSRSFFGVVRLHGHVAGLGIYIAAVKLVKALSPVLFAAVTFHSIDFYFAFRSSKVSANTNGADTGIFVSRPCLGKTCCVGNVVASSSSSSDWYVVTRVAAVRAAGISALGVGKVVFPHC